jgi:periplasmic protein TonB
MNTDITLINNTSYGAPELKRSYQVFTLKGFIIAITIHIALVAAYMLFAYVNESKAKDIHINKDFKFVEIETPPSINEEEIPSVKPDEIIKQTKDLSALQPQPVKKEVADDIKLKTQDELNKLETTAGREGDSLVASLTDPGKIKIDDSKIDIKIKTEIPTVKTTYTEYEVEKAPVCTNLQQVKGSLQYPQSAIEIGAEGKVMVKVLVGEDGSVLKIGAVSGNELFHDEVKEKARNLQFTPGLNNNTAVKVWVNVPFSFKLK